MSPNDRLDFAAIRDRLNSARGKEYWRSLEELAGTDGFLDFLREEFPRYAPEKGAPVSRRNFMKLIGASLALAGLGACASPPASKVVPYVRPPEGEVPGLPLFFSTAMTVGGYAMGLLVESHTGRPTKVEGNPDHPASLGSTDVLAQASVLGLYDPDRSNTVMQGAQASNWDAFLAALKGALDAQHGSQGGGLRILSETITSPTMASQMQALLKTFPSAKWYQYEPVNEDNARAGARLAFGDDVETYYRLDKAQVILSLDSDFMSEWPAGVRYEREFADGRRLVSGKTEMNRLYVVESGSTITGASSDHRLPLRPSQIESFARALARQLGLDVEQGVALDTKAVPDKWLPALARDLQAHEGSSAVLAGRGQPPAVHALAHAMNQVLGNVGQTVIYTAPVAVAPAAQIAGLKELVADMAAGKVELLVILEGNPVYNAPADLDFTGALAKVGTSVHLGLYFDETAAKCKWHVPATHFLEGWSDARAYDGTVTIMQPLIAPLYGGKSPHEIVALLNGDAAATSHDIVQGYWKDNVGGGDFQTFWEQTLTAGSVAKTALASKSVQIAGGKPQLPAPAAAGQGIELVFRPDPHIFDGRFANNGWLQELPKPITKLTWDNAILVGPALAERLGVGNYQMVELRYQGRSLHGPVWIVPGHPQETVTVHLGFGRSQAGRVGSGAGFNAYALRTSDSPWFATGVEVAKAGGTMLLATTQNHHTIDGRDILRTASLDEYHKDPKFAAHAIIEEPPTESLYPPIKYEGHAWGMAIDLSVCTGCNACVIACQAENNIPVVGKDQVSRWREMLWLRVDHYYEGDMDNPVAYQQPVPCMQCENAPCELVCPVGATTHSDEGLNDMVYNRCVGTRYCSNNCPYKVRRFNFYEYTDWAASQISLLHNPEVTVRARGVMEKCTYCVQRITRGRIDAERENRPVRDGEIKTACQQACPTQAIVFGDINDPNSQVAKLKQEARNYAMLPEQNTRPRTTYLGAVRNINSEIG